MKSSIFASGALGATLLAALFLAAPALLSAEATGNNNGSNNSSGTPGYLKIGSTWTGVGRWFDGKAVVSIMESKLKVKEDIPTDGRHGAFGYAWLTSGFDNVLVVVTHLGIDDSSHEDHESGLHAHVLDLKAATPACAGYDAEVDLPGSMANAGFDKDYDFEIHGSKLKVKNVPASDLGDTGVEAIAAFTVKPVLDSGGNPTNLCVDVVENPYGL